MFKEARTHTQPAPSLTEAGRHESLIKTGALQDAIMNSANFSCIATDEKGVIQIFNIGAERMLGYQAVNVLDQITPADISDPQEIIERAGTLSAEYATRITPGFEALVFKAARGIEDIYELTYIRKDGSRFPAVVSVTALRDAQNKIIGYLLIGTDNTAREAARAERRQLLDEQTRTNRQLQDSNVTLHISEERLAVTLNSIGDAVIATDAEARVTVLNPLAERLTGWSQAEAIGRHVDDVFHLINRETRLPCPMPIKATLAHGTLRGMADHTVLIASNGRECTIADSCAPIRDRDNRVIGAVLVFRDVTDEYVAQQSLRDNATLLQNILNTVADGIITFQADNGVIETINPAAAKMFGYAAVELIGLDFNMLIDEIDRGPSNIFNEYYSNTPAHAIDLSHELVGLRKDGSTFPVELTVSEMQLREDRYFTCILRDINERNRLNKILLQNNQELMEAKLAADKANLAKSDFLSRMSHELRTPLNAILGFSQLLQAGAPSLTVAQHERMEQISKAGWYLLELINEILDLAVIESGSLTLSPEPVSLTEVMHECQTLTESQAQQHQLQLRFHPFDPSWFIYADRTRVKQILINLLTNAIKYNCASGTVDVACSIGTPDRIRVTIKDSGAGLPPEKLQQLFQPFNRLGQENGIEEGTGMGLVVAKQLTELMGGHIGVNSTVGSGSEFWVELIRCAAPQFATTEAAAAANPPAPAVNVKPCTLLYVEDNPANMMLVEHIVKEHTQVNLLSAHYGKLGITLAQKHRPEVILLDINLPDIGGVEALKILRQDAATQHIPVIALSANAMQHDIEMGLHAGFFRYLTKPIKINEFLDALDAALKFSKSTSVSSSETRRLK